MANELNMPAPATTDKAVALKIVAVDDNPADLELLRVVLARQTMTEMEFHGHCSPSSALGAICDLDPDLIFVDYSLPGMSGLEFLETVRAAGVDSPAILLTGSGNEAVAVSALHSGFSDYLAKQSLSASCLKRTILNATDKYKLAKQAKKYRSDLETAVEELATRNREISTFYHTLAHELKTPLTGAREYVSIVRDGILGAVTEEQAGLLTSAIGSCDQLRHCIDDLFDVSRIETGKLRVEPLSADLTAVVKQGVGCLAKQAASAEVDLNLEVSSELPAAYFDPQRILQVVNNLVGNAIKFTPKGGRVAVACQTQSAGFLEVRVTDNGMGIEPEVLERVFDRLYQAEGNATIKGGMGLGLHLCYELVRLNGGQIYAASTMGEGSTFSFTVPLMNHAR